jgi:hypothetical protein
MLPGGVKGPASTLSGGSGGAAGKLCLYLMIEITSLLDRWPLANFTLCHCFLCGSVGSTLDLDLFRFIGCNCTD